MPYYARVIFATDATAAERHDDLGLARRWIDKERRAQPELFRSGQIIEATPDRRVVAMCDITGWGDMVAL